MPLLWLLVLVLVIGWGCADESLEVPCWKPCDLTFVSTIPHDHPFAVAFGAAITAPDGRVLKSDGFYSGEATWTLRVGPDCPGIWQVATCSDDASLAGRTARFTCVANTDPRIHGALRVDREHPHRFVYEDGHRDFLLAYECDWLWALDQTAKDLTTLLPFLDTIAASGFNHILVNAWAYDTSWCKGNQHPDHPQWTPDVGPSPLQPWGGSATAPDHGLFDLAYWRHYDRMMEALRQRGLTAHLMFKVYNKQVRWPAKGSSDDDRYFAWITARYGAFPNVVWDLTKEAYNEKDVAYKQDRLRFIRAHDPYARLRTIHDDDKPQEAGAYDGLIEFVTDQQHTDFHATILRQRARFPLPILNAENSYECGPLGPADRTYRVSQPTEEVFRRLWSIAMAGGLPGYYYTYTAWDVIRVGDRPPGYAWAQQLSAVARRTRLWAMEPADHLVAGTGAGEKDLYCLADQGRAYLAYAGHGQPFAITLPRLDASLSARWFHPATGEQVAAGSVGAGTSRWTPPAHWPQALWYAGPQDAGGPP